MLKRLFSFLGIDRSSKKNVARAFNGRRLRLEALESRELLAVSVDSWDGLRTAINNAITGTGESDIVITDSFTRGDGGSTDNAHIDIISSTNIDISISGAAFTDSSQRITITGGSYNTGTGKYVSGDTMFYVENVNLMLTDLKIVGFATLANAHSGHTPMGTIDVRSGADLTVSRCIFEDMTDGSGYALYGDDGTMMTVSNSLIDHCGGGIYAANTGELISAGGDSDVAMSFIKNQAKDYGGAIASTGALSATSFAATNKPTFGRTNTNEQNKLTTPSKQSCGIDFAKGYGGVGEFEVLPYNGSTGHVDVEFATNIRNYHFDAGGDTQSVSFLPVEEEFGFATSTKILLDTNNDDVYEDVSWISPKELGLSVGKNALNTLFVDASGST